MSPTCHTAVPIPGGGGSWVEGRLEVHWQIPLQKGRYHSNTPAKGESGEETSSLRVEGGNGGRRGKQSEETPLLGRLGKHRKMPRFCLAFPVAGNLQIKGQPFPLEGLQGGTFVCEPHTPWGGDSFAVAVTNPVTLGYKSCPGPPSSCCLQMAQIFCFCFSGGRELCFFEVSTQMI